MNAEKDSSNYRVVFQVDDGLMRAFARRLIRENYGLVGSSFSSSIIHVSAKQFSVLCASILSPQEANAALMAVRGSESGQFENASGSIAKQIIDEFSRKMAGKLSEKLIVLGFCFATAGAYGAVELASRFGHILV